MYNIVIIVWDNGGIAYEVFVGFLVKTTRILINEYITIIIIIIILCMFIICPFVLSDAMCMCRHHQIPRSRHQKFNEWQLLVVKNWLLRC